MEVFGFKFRPSGHSEEYTIFAYYETESDAEVALEAVSDVIRKADKEEIEVDWSSEDITVNQEGRMLKINVYTAGYLDEIKDALYFPTDIEIYNDYVELEIRLRLPKSVSLDFAPLLLQSEDLRLLHALNKECGPPRVEEDGDEKIYTWIFRGSGALYESDNVLRIIDSEYTLTENWEVTQFG
ncbi:MAG: hypothetical protein QXG08_03520 [Candidatus Methanomethyliaceae archaeon]